MASEKGNVFVERYLTPLSVLLAAIIIGGALIISSNNRGVAPAGEHDGLTRATMDEIAESVDMDVDRIHDLLAKNGELYQAAIEADQTEGQSFGIQGTPGTIVGKIFIPGAYPLADVLGALEGKDVPLPEGTEPADVSIAQVKLDTSPSHGSVDAPTVMAVWYDFQCSFCKRFEAETLAALEETHVATGKLRIVYKDFQFLGPASVEAGAYSRAVWEAYPDKWHAWFKGMMRQ
ncbi:MAG TPA: thioredoxin domain-containing protein [Candidatus Paceibacterota bacterium]|jgi:protein-disulfide isomerase